MKMQQPIIYHIYYIKSLLKVVVKWCVFMYEQIATKKIMMNAKFSCLIYFIYYITSATFIHNAKDNDKDGIETIFQNVYLGG